MATQLGKIVADFTTQLATAMAVGATSATLQSATDDDGVALPSGRYFFTIDGDNSRKEHISCNLSGTSLTSIKSVSRQGVETSGCARLHRIGATVVITDFASIKYLNDLLDGTTNLNASEPLEYDGTATINANNQLATKAYVDGVAIAGAPDSSTSVKGISKLSVAAVSAGNPIVVGDNDYRISPNNYGADSGGTDTYAITLASAPTGYATGQVYAFKANTANTGTATLNVNSLGAKTILRSDGATLLTGDILANQLVQVQYNGADFVMISSPANTVNLAGGIYPTGSGENITNVIPSLAPYIADGGIDQNDSVYVSASGTVKRMVPSGMASATTISTSPTYTNYKKAFPTSTSGRYIYFSGGVSSSPQALAGEIRAMSSDETNFTNVGNNTISTSVYYFDACEISTDKWCLIYQKSTAGVASGIGVKIVSGASVTVGSEATIETLGNSSYMPSCAKIDTDKVAIFYQKDADGDLYCQVLTVSGTTISTNTPVLVKVASGAVRTSADQISTNTILLTYQDASTSPTTVFGRTISVSGTTPTVNSEQTIVTIGGASGWNFRAKTISSTKAFFVYANSGASTNDTCLNITISGSTLTAGSTLALSSNRLTEYFGISLIGTTRIIIAELGANQVIVKYLDVSGTTPTEISSQTLTATSAVYSTFVVKAAPYVYVVDTSNPAFDYIVKMTPVTNRIGVAQNSIANAATGNILYRFSAQTLSGITLTAGSVYYVDDNSQPTLSSSLSAPILGHSITSTKIFTT